MTLICSFLGGPSSGKSTLGFEVISKLKARGHKAEFVPEYAKELVYRRDFATIADQGLVTREQDRRLRDLLGHVDFVIHDTALPLGIIYAQGDFKQDWFTNRVWALYNGYNNFNTFVRRVKPFQQYGRMQNEQESRALDGTILNLFGPERINLTVDGKEGSGDVVYEAIVRHAEQNGSI